MANERFQTLPNGAVYDTVQKKIVKAVTMPVEPPKSPDTDEKTASSGNSSKGKKKAVKTEVEKMEAHVSHTQIAREILAYNRTHKADKTNIKWLEERGFWYFDRCIECGVTPIPQGLVLALGFKPQEQSLLLSGNNGLPPDCKELILEFKQALELAMEGALVDSKSGTVGRIFDLKNRFGWADNPNQPVTEGQKFGEIKSPEELKKALAKMPNLDLIDEPKEVNIVDADYEIVE